MRRIKSPTRYFVILGRTDADGTEGDVAAHQCWTTVQ
jgi:hypothetical protein